MRALLAIVVLAGCFAPSVPTGVPCGPGGSCPAGQACAMATNTCGDGAVPPDGGDVVPPDGEGPGCDPGEVLVDGACTILLSNEVAPSPVSAAGCATGDSNNSRSVAIDEGNRIYVAFRCGNTDDVFVVVSGDGGASAGAAADIGVGAARGVAIAGGARKVAYLATSGDQGVAFAVTVDGGATWTKQVLDSSAPNNNFPVAVAAFGDRVYVAASFGGSNVRVWRNGNRGSGAFDSVNVQLDHVYGDMIVSPLDGTVWVAGDSPQLHVRKSIDGGATFAPVIDPPASYNFSDWTTDGTTIFASGEQPTFTRIDTTDPGDATTVAAMLPNVRARGRSISAAADGALYVTSEPASGVWVLQRFAAGASSAPSRTPGTGTGPSVIAGPGAAAPFVFTETASTKVMLGVALF